MENELVRYKSSIKSRKKTESNEGCSQCSAYKQEVDLLKQMVRSTQGMVRVKEIENSKYRIQSGEDLHLNHSKSIVKTQEKGTPLPPLKKKP